EQESLGGLRHLIGQLNPQFQNIVLPARFRILFRKSVDEAQCFGPLSVLRQSANEVIIRAICNLVLRESANHLAKTTLSVGIPSLVIKTLPGDKKVASFIGR